MRSGGRTFTPCQPNIAQRLDVVGAEAAYGRGIRATAVGRVPALGVAATLDGASIASDGSVVRGEVVAARHGSKGDFVTVRLDPPLDREVDLRAWSGRPAVGTVLTVRYKRSDPSRAIDASLRMPWDDMAPGLGVGLIFAVLSWGIWTGTWYGNYVVEASRPIRWRRR